VSIDGEIISEIGRGVLLLLAVEKGDTEKLLEWGARKCAELRAFEDDSGRMNRSLLDIGGEAMVVSQFTLAGSVRKGRRPSFDSAEAPEIAERKYEFFCRVVSDLEIPVKTGSFGAMMAVELVNDGPVTFMIERKADA
jgi:D-tyrosyl-tRNA(Tyr) deacylase